MTIRFEVNGEKAIEAIAWLARAMPGITFYYIVKILFFADKMHLNRFGRPIIGDRYIAMDHGPVPSLVYDVLKQDSFADPGLLEHAAKAFYVNRQGPYPSVYALGDYVHREDLFSRTDLACLKESLDVYGQLSVPELRRKTHEEPAYEEAELNGEIDYELMIDPETPEKEQIIENLKEVGRAIVF